MPFARNIELVGYDDLAGRSEFRLAMTEREVPDGYPVASFCDKGGRFGPHTQHQPQNQPCLMPIADYAYVSEKNSGITILPFAPPACPDVS